MNQSHFLSENSIRKEMNLIYPSHRRWWRSAFHPNNHGTQRIQPNGVDSRLHMSFFEPGPVPPCLQFLIRLAFLIKKAVDESPEKGEIKQTVTGVQKWTVLILLPVAKPHFRKSTFAFNQPADSAVSPVGQGRGGEMKSGRFMYSNGRQCCCCFFTELIRMLRCTFVNLTAAESLEWILPKTCDESEMKSLVMFWMFDRELKSWLCDFELYRHKNRYSEASKFRKTWPIL